MIFGAWKKKKQFTSVHYREQFVRIYEILMPILEKNKLVYEIISHFKLTWVFSILKKDGPSCMKYVS